MCADGIVGNTQCYPHCTLRARAHAHHLHYPCFVGVADGEGLTFGAISITLHQRCHYGNGLTSGLATLKRNMHQRTVIEHTRRVYHLFTTTVCSLGYRHLKLVYVTNDVVGHRCLCDFSMIDLCVAIKNLTNRAVGMSACRIMAQITKHSVVVGAVGTHHRTVGTRILADNKICAGRSSCNHTNSK